jgi:hypothetical protein
VNRSFSIVMTFTLLAALFAFSCFAQDKKDDLTGPGTDPKGIPIELKIINSALEAYEVNSLGDPYFKYQENIRKAEKSGELLPSTHVEMELEITNKGTEAIQIWVSGDATLLALELKGNGAMTASAKFPPVTSFIPPEVVKIAPGKSHRIPLTDLCFGFRNKATHAYVTEPGVYRLSASFRTGVYPPPQKATKILQKGFGEVLLRAAPIDFRAVRPS